MRPRRSAFTLLELTLTMTIVALCLALVAPRFAALRDGASVRGAVNEIGATFADAREMAIVRAAPVAIVFDTAGAAVEIHANGQSVTRRTLAEVYGVRIESNRDSAVYDARGYGYGVSNLSVTVHRGAVADTLTMSKLGRVRW
ncbi:MAG TPA: prepilin-type N-terminal cleavage/methylation domain-containing protein [Gemmatimonadaceae bacterium]|jgi:prepilin-type N-terminal cleavage/methylation domain-containing protein